MKIRQLSEQEIMTVSGGNSTDCTRIVIDLIEHNDVNAPPATPSFIDALNLYSQCESGQLNLSEV